MLVANDVTNDKFETVTPASSKFNLVYTTATNYGQLYINGFSQANLNTGLVSKQFKEVKHGAYQQIGLPFIGKTLSDLTSELGKTFNNTRYSGNEILYWDNPKVLSRNLSTATVTTAADATRYYILGGTGLDITTANKTIVGKPFADPVTVTLNGAGAGINFGVNGVARNIYNEKYNSYVSDPFVTPAWNNTTSNYGKDMYQLANPYFTNLDLSQIGISEANGDGVNIPGLVGIIIQPSINNVTFNTTTGSADVSPNFVTFTSGLAPSGDVDKLVIKPLQSFTIKRSNGAASYDFPFANLRRFAFAARTSFTGPISVTGAKNANRSNSGSTIKQLGVIALDADGNEMGRTYFVVYPNGVSGFNPEVSTQATAGKDNVIGTFEEKAVDGGVDTNYASQYWLYINEANEQDFKGKPLEMDLYSPAIKSLKFEIRENAQLVDAGVKVLSTGTGFYYKDASGNISEASQDSVIPVNGSQYNLFYGKPDAVLATGNAEAKPSRTVIVYNQSIDNYIVRFDSTWKKADIQVYDLSGKLIMLKKNVPANQDFTIPLSKDNRAYIVTAVSESGVKAVAKIIR